jgi:hypothetical protein
MQVACETAKYVTGLNKWRETVSYDVILFLNTVMYRRKFCLRWSPHIPFSGEWSAVSEVKYRNWSFDKRNFN